MLNALLKEAFDMKTILCRAYQFIIRLISLTARWRVPTLLEGPNSVLQLPAQLQKDQVHHPLLITGPTLRRLGTVDALVAALEARGIACEVFDRVANDPTIANVEDARTCYLENQCDAILAVGGGSPLDCAKLCGARVARPDRTIPQMRGMLRVRKALPPLYAVPTTSGTGSEVTIAAVVTDEHHRKFAVGDFVLIPSVAVLDPVLTLGMPASVTAASGMDALSHAVEAFIGHSNTAQTRQDALRAVRMIYTSLENACKDGKDLAARTEMQKAAYYAGLAFTRANVGYVHAIAHAVGGRYGVAHGAACAVAMPAVLRAYGKAAYPALAALADAAGTAKPSQTVAERAEGFITSIETLNAAIGLPKGFASLLAADIPLLASQASQEGNYAYPAPKVLFKPALEQIFMQLLQPAAA